MPGIVSIVEGAAGEYVRQSWDLLERELGFRAASAGAVPHVTYHVSEAPYRAGALRDEIDAEATNSEPFEVPATGLGVFTGQVAVVYLAMTHTDRIADLQHRASECGERYASGTAAHWRRERWVPHVTIAMEGLTPELTPGVLALLLPRTRPMPVEIDNLALFGEQFGEYQPVGRWDFSTSEVQEL